MKVQRKDMGPCRVQLSVQADANAVRDDFETTVDGFRRQAAVPGFRAGKAPREVLIRHHRKAIETSARESATARLYREALRETGIQPVAILDLQDESFSPDDGIRFAVILDVAPDFKLPRYKGLSITDERRPVTPEQIEAQLASVRKMLAQYADKPDHVLSRGDAAQIDYTGSLDEKPITEIENNCRDLGEGRDQWVEIEAESLLPGLGLALVGMRLGESRAIPVTFPNEYHQASVAGKTASYTVTIKAVRACTLPELDDDFARRLGADNLAALQERIQSQLEQRATEQETARRHTALSDELIKSTTFDLPQSVVEEEMRHTIRAMVSDVMRRGGSPETLKEHRDALIKNATESSDRSVRLHYILTRIAQEEQISVDDEEVSQRIRGLAKQARITEPELRDRIAKQRGMDRLISDIRAEKAMGIVLDEAKIK